MVEKVKGYREISGKGELKLNFHLGQGKAWQSEARFPVILGGTQLGKTCFAPDWMEREIRRKGPGDYLAITATFPLLNLKLLPEFRYVFESLYHTAVFKEVHGSRILVFNREKKKPGDVVLFDDAAYEEAGVRETRIVFGSATNPESLESATAKAAVLDECGQKQFRRDSWEATLRRLSLAQGRALMLTTLYGYGWLKSEVYDEWVKGNPDFDIIQVDSIVNPAFPMAEWERAKATMPAWKFDLFYRGRFAKPAGLIYDSFDSSSAVIEPFDIPENWPVYVGHDFGQVNMAALWIAQDPATGYLYVFQEYLAGGLASFEHVNKWIEMSKGHRIMKRVGGAHTEDGWRGDFTQAGWRIDEPTERGVAAGIQKIYGLFKTGKLFTFRTCPNFIDELNSYSYELDEKYQPIEGKIENKERYHLCDCVRGVGSDFNPVASPGKRDQVWYY
uniref:Putative terminase n=1 Tax=viral metagenome TaxID=1070528 RepID=A0A6M3J7W0_9ZZZZ